MKVSLLDEATSRLRHSWFCAVIHLQPSAKPQTPNLSNKKLKITQLVPCSRLPASPFIISHNTTPFSFLDAWSSNTLLSVLWLKILDRGCRNILKDDELFARFLIIRQIFSIFAIFVFLGALSTICSSNNDGSLRFFDRRCRNTLRDNELSASFLTVSQIFSPSLQPSHF